MAQLSLPVFNQLSTTFAEKSVQIHYRKTELREVSLPKDKVEYFSDNLFTDDVPCRVIVCFMKNERKLGNYQNPYEFRRFWDVSVPGIEFATFNREQFLEEKLLRLERTLQLVLEEKTLGKGKGRGKQSKSGNSSSFFSRFRSQQDRASTSSQQSGFDEVDDDDEQPPPPYSERIGGTKRIFVKKVELLLNGSPLGIIIN